MSRSSPQPHIEEEKEVKKKSNICDRCKQPLKFCNDVTMTYKKRTVRVCVACAAIVEKKYGNHTIGN